MSKSEMRRLALADPEKLAEANIRLRARVEELERLVRDLADSIEWITRYDDGSKDQARIDRAVVDRAKKVLEG